MVETTEEYRNRINQLKNSIENEPYIKKMRENIAEGISKTGNRQADIEDQFQEVIDNTTGKDVIAAPELIAARNGKPNLKTRIDDLENETNRQLAETEQEVTARLEQKADKSEIGAPSQEQVNTWLNDNPDATTTVQDNSLTTDKLTNETIDFLHPAKLQNAIENDVNKMNLLKGINKGELNFYLSAATYEYVDNISFLSVDKVLRFNYQSGAGSMLRPDTVINAGNPKWGAWIRESDLNNLGSQTIRMGVRTGSTQYSGGFFTKEQAVRLGYVNTTTSNGITIQTSVVSKHFGWVYIVGEIISSSVQLVGYTLFIQTGTQPVSGKLDIANLTVIDTVNRLIPYHIYPESAEEIIPSNKELSSRVSLLENSTETGEFTNIRGNIISDSLGAPSEGYAMVIENYLGMSNRFNRHAVGGRPLANGTANGEGANTYGKSWNGVPIDYLLYQLSLIAVGTNDFKLNVPIGELKSHLPGIYDTNTFIGALQDLIEYILRKNPNINLLLFTPLQRDNDGYSTTSTNTSGHMLIDYVDAMISVGNRYGITVYDMYRNSGVNPLTLSTFTYDGLHLNGQTVTPGPGYKFVGTKMAKFIKNNVVIV